MWVRPLFYCINYEQVNKKINDNKDIKKINNDKTPYVNKLLNNVNVKINNKKEMKPRMEMEESIKIATKKHIEEKRRENN